MIMVCNYLLKFKENTIFPYIKSITGGCGLHHILLIEDDTQIVEMLQNYLSRQGYTITVAFNGLDGIDLFSQNTFDMILVDIMMPSLDGIEVIKLIRQNHSVPIIIMSAKDSDIDKVIGLGFGADDYIAKPFSLIEMSARIKAVMRRVTMHSNSIIGLSAKGVSEQKPYQQQALTFGTLRIDLNNYSVSKDKTNLKLTAKEFEILKLFVTNPNRVFTKAQLYGFIWNDVYYGDENVINVHIRRLREKIEDEPSDPKYIKTLWGIGYKWESQ